MHIDTSMPKGTRQAKVSRILTFSCVDGPGNRLVIFFQGCNFNCTSCHNPHSIAHCNHCGICVAECNDNALTFNEKKEVIWHADKCTDCDKCIDICTYQSSPKIRQYSVEDIVGIIEENHPFLNGITVSGGESSLQLPFIISLFKTVKSHPKLNNLSCFMDSNGSLSEQGWQKIEPYLDGAMIDLKSWGEYTHEMLVGRDNKAVFNSINLLAKLNKLYEIRLLPIPNQTDYFDNMPALIDYFKKLPSNIRIRLNAFQHHGVVGEALFWEKGNETELELFEQKLEAELPHQIIKPSLFV